jgi:hypothetical protein
MEELMTAVFVAHTKVLTAVRLSSKQRKLSITVPKLDHFIHRVFRESARCFWKTPFLFMSDNGVVERQKNLLQIEALASEAITTAVRGLLPVKQILQDYLGDDEETIEEAALVAPSNEEKKEDVAEPVTPKKEEAPATKKEEIEVASPPKKEEVVSPPKKEEVASDTKEIVPAVVSIDTEPTVHFSNYDDVFDEANGAPEIKYNPKDGEGEGEDDQEGSDALTVDEASTKDITDDEFEDLEAPKPVAKSTPLPKKETIDDADVVVLE